uniref:ER membrane protein complex subunit 10 n=1 Tax=Branchiostoma floridae TaxID=7739 RepID=C3ZM04_BRAFL|eukprot:XP_002590404.1 hypothetical protein BRAFLDRAFT_65219 [Branchiostoma floridae]
MATTMESFSRFCLWFLVFLPVICFCQVLSDMDLPAGAAPQPNIPTLSVTVEHSFDQVIISMDILPCENCRKRPDVHRPWYDILEDHEKYQRYLRTGSTTVRARQGQAKGEYQRYLLYVQNVQWVPLSEQDRDRLKASTSDTYVQWVPLSERDRDRLKVLADAGGFYRIRVPNKFGLIGDSTTDYVSTLVRADLLYNSCLSDIITLNIDMLGHIIGVAMATVPEGCEGDEVETFDLSLFNTTVEIAQPVTGPVPETQAYIQKIEQERAEKEKGQPPEQRSFFAKYWMYILPIVLFLILSPGQPEGGQGGGGQGGGGRGGNGGG